MGGWVGEVGGGLTDAAGKGAEQVGCRNFMLLGAEICTMLTQGGAVAAALH